MAIAGSDSSTTLRSCACECFSRKRKGASPLANVKFYLAGYNRAHGVKAKTTYIYPNDQTRMLFGLLWPWLPSHDARDGQGQERSKMPKASLS